MKNFKTDLVINYASLGFLALAGLSINLFIGKNYGSAALGVFNQVYAFYVVASQFGVCALQYSTQKNSAQWQNDLSSLKNIYTSALLLVGGLSMFVAFFTWVGSGLWADLAKSPDTGFGLQLIVPAFFFFALNKISIALLNGLQKMRMFAFAQSLRFIFMIAAMIVMHAANVSSKWLPIIFLAAEAPLCAILLFINRHFLGRASKSWLRAHVKFGAKGVLSGVLAELNPRVDILLLGFFVSDSEVGVYSFAAIFAEGFFQVFVVLKNFFNPMMAKLISSSGYLQIQEFIRGFQPKIFLGALAGYVALLGFVFVFNRFFLRAPDYESSLALLAILSAGMVISSGVLSFDGLLLQANFPGHYTGLNLVILGSNAVLNLLLIPYMGLFGAALGTAISYCAGAVYLNGVTLKLTKVRIIR